MYIFVISLFLRCSGVFQDCGLGKTMPTKPIMPEEEDKVKDHQGNHDNVAMTMMMIIILLNVATYILTYSTQLPAFPHRFWGFA